MKLLLLPIGLIALGQETPAISPEGPAEQAPSTISDQNRCPVDPSLAADRSRTGNQMFRRGPDMSGPAMAIRAVDQRIDGCPILVMQDGSFRAPPAGDTPAFRFVPTDRR